MSIVTSLGFVLRYIFLPNVKKKILKIQILPLYFYLFGLLSPDSTADLNHKFKAANCQLG